MVKNFVIVIAGAKGGVGKTTTSINLGAALAENGQSVVAVEMDLPMPNFVDFLDVDLEEDGGATLLEVLNEQAPIQNAVYETPNGLSIIPSAPDLDTYENTSLDAFPEIIERLRWYFDIILIDTPAGLSDEALESLEVGDEAIIISSPRKASTQNATETIELARRYDTSVRGFVLNKSGSGASPGVDTIAESLPVDVLGHVPEDDAIPHSQDIGQPVVVNSPNSGAAIAYKRLARSILGDETDQRFDSEPGRDASSSSSSKIDDSESEKMDSSPADSDAGSEETVDQKSVDAENELEDSTSATEDPETEDGNEDQELRNYEETSQNNGTPMKGERDANDDSLINRVKHLFRSP